MDSEIVGDKDFTESKIKDLLKYTQEMKDDMENELDRKAVICQAITSFILVLMTLAMIRLIKK